ncbi:hypothetical protein [Aromatoleum buckelii]|uniref:Uncharacterized protein n=1 Tax=Aromatoleum buckelii TaxID=200254 RepID=A0ABX1N338_9RHOO|nr:hypothetical protein [Aromatoleum buckelii]MCK0513207.1 hypothetical protein [Aromatoleum buckelii]
MSELAQPEPPGAADVVDPRCGSRPCQQDADTKAFTGRGGAPADVRQAQVRVASIHRQQEELSRLTRRVRGRTFYLAVHRRKDTGQVHLRWRAAGAGVRAGHIPWGAIHAQFAQLPGALREWYERIHRHAIELNRREIEARLAQRHACERNP